MKSLINNLRLVGAFFFVVSFGYLYTAQSIPLDFWSEQEPFNARSLPYLIGISCAVVSILLMVLPSPKFEWEELRELNYLPALLLLGLMSSYGLLIDILGFVISTTALLTVGFVILGERNPLRIGLISIGTTALFWAIMDLLGIYLSPGELYLGWS
ncbi:MAG: putative tricarboxylic transport membrane protein [Patiriisocius sp.]|jgi:putative tricarboxylic transport membrane protein